MAESEKEKKARQRAEKRDKGLVQVSVWVSPEHAEDLRNYAKTLAKEKRKKDPRQLSFI